MNALFHRRQHAVGTWVTVLLILTSILDVSCNKESPLRHLFDDDDWERVLKNRKFLTQKGRDENAAAKLFQSGRHRDLQSNGFHAAGARTWNVIVCLMNWSNHGDRTTLSVADVETWFTGTGRDNPLHPGGSINDYFQAMSQGQFKLSVHVADWVKTSKSETFYTQDGSQGRSQEIQEAFKPVLEALDSSNIDFSQYDSDGDSEIDMTIFLHSGYDGVYPGDDCKTGVSPSERIGSHYRLRSSQSTWVSKSGYKLGSYVVVPAYYGNCDLEINGMGVMLHEIIHSFGIPELYEPGDFAASGYLGGIDYYDIMANPWQPGFDSRYPGPITAWTKTELGWLTPVEITGDGVYTIRASEEAPDAYVINKGYATGEYLLLENRQPIEGSFDRGFFTPGGVTVYHIDESIWDLFAFQGIKGNTPKGGPFQGDWPSNGKHYPVALLQADGLYELEQNINGGDSGDMYSSPDQVLGPGNGEAIAQDAIYPNTDSYAFGTISVTGITIKNFQYTDGTTMTFEVTGLGPSQGLPPTNSPDTPLPTNAPMDQETSPPTSMSSENLTDTPTTVSTTPVTNTPSITEAPTNSTTFVPETADPSPESVAPTLSATESPTVFPSTNTPTTGDNSTETTGSPTTPPEGGGESASGIGCEFALSAAVDGSAMSGSTVDATDNVDAAFCGTNITTSGRWFTFNGTGNPVDISACDQEGSNNFDVSVSVFSGSSCEALSCVSGATFTDEVCSTTQTSLRGRLLQESGSIPLSLTADEGSTYFVFVHGHNPSSSDGGGVGKFELFITENTGDDEQPENLPSEKAMKKNITSEAPLVLYFDADNVTVVSAPSNGTVTVQNETTLVYVSNEDFVGLDSFDVKKCPNDDNCSKVNVIVEVSKDESNEGAKDKEKDDDKTHDTGSSMNKKAWYSLLILLIFVPLLWIFRKRIFGCCASAERSDMDDCDTSQSPDKSSTRKLVETPFQDEEDNNHGYTDDDDNELVDSNDDDIEDETVENEERETSESQVDDEDNVSEDDEEEDDDDDTTSTASQDVQGDSDEENSQRDIV
jgi:M6 family metalloprotease-like protein